MKIPEPVAEFKVALIGDGGVGKTSFVNSHITKQFEKCYSNSQGFNVFPLIFSTNHGIVKLNIWDAAGREKMGTLREGYYLGSNTTILMFDVTTRITYRNAPLWYKDLIRVIDNIPIVLVGNKVDKENRKVKPKQITFNRK